MILMQRNLVVVTEVVVSGTQCISIIVIDYHVIAFVEIVSYVLYLCYTS